MTVKMAVVAPMPIASAATDSTAIPFAVFQECQPRIRCPTCPSVQSGLREQSQELLHRSHIDRLRRQLALAVKDERLGNALHTEQLMHLAPRIEQHWIADLLLVRDEAFHNFRLFV